MTPHSRASLRVWVAAVAIAAATGQPVSAQYGARTGADLPRLPWENDRVRVSLVTAEPGAALPAGPNRVLVYLTADPAGVMPAEAVWQPSGADGAVNRGPVRVEAIAIELKEDAPPSSARGTLPEALASMRLAEVSVLVDNPRVLVTKHRFRPYAWVTPLHFHPEDLLIVYLRGGYAWPADGRWGAYRVRRGELDVVPANTFHTLANAGSDPIDFLVIAPR